jgi:DNA primase small subunit
MGTSATSAAASASSTDAPRPLPNAAVPKCGRLTIEDSDDDSESKDRRRCVDGEDEEKDGPMLHETTRSSSPSSSSLEEVEETISNKNTGHPSPKASSSFPSSSSVTTVVVTPSSASSSRPSEAFSPELLYQYYSRLFPFDFLHSWLSYGCPGVFSRREFSMTIEPSPGEEIYIRYQSFSTQKELSDAVLRRKPVKIDLGAIFSHPPKDHKSIPSGAFVPLQRELVFDVDLTDYDSIRACGCQGAQICAKCWSFMKMAVKVVDEGLREDFGFEHIAWFYSGRRGVHCWVCDESARELTDAGRSAVASYFEVITASVR